MRAANGEVFDPVLYKLAKQIQSNTIVVKNFGEIVTKLTETVEAMQLREARREGKESAISWFTKLSVVCAFCTVLISAYTMSITTATNATLVITKEDEHIELTKATYETRQP